jgi:hypothetical protein
MPSYTYLVILHMNLYYKIRVLPNNSTILLEFDNLFVYNESMSYRNIYINIY